MEPNYFAANKELWNAKTPAHVSSEFYDVETFKQTKNSLNPIELEQLGNVSGKELLHLQCHFGMDTLSWANLGAKATGVDISNVALAKARELSKELNIEADFIESNILDLSLTERFDIVYASYGAIGWFPDINSWAKIAADHLKPGGEFHIIELHPVLQMFDDDMVKLEYPYYNTGVNSFLEEGTYADKNASISKPGYWWNHGLAEVIMAFRNLGLTFESLSEFPYSPYDCFPNMVKGEDGNYRLKVAEGIIPMVYGLKMVKPI